MVVEIPLWLLITLAFLALPTVVSALLIGVGLLVLAIKDRRKS